MTDDDGLSFHRNEGANGTGNSGKKRLNECSSDSQFSSQRRRNQESYRIPSEIIMKIISASYGPCEYNCFDDSDESRIPLTRDCTAFLVDLLAASQRREVANNERDEVPINHYWREQHERDKCNGIVRVPPTVNGNIESFVYLLPGVDTSSGDYSHLSSKTSNHGREHISMNAVFGDPCPGKTKRLEVKYTVTEVYKKDKNSRTSSPSLLPYIPTEIHRVSFAEHETVKLRRYLTTVNTMKAIGENYDFERDKPGQPGRGDESLQGNRTSWRFQSGTSEIVLPIILPFLNLWERMQCRLICRCWKNIVQECGVSRTIDVNSTEIISRRLTTLVTPGTTTNSYILTRSMLRGLLAYSYSSLQSLFLNGFTELQKEDLHPALPCLRNLNVLDISHCIHLDNSTLQLLANPDLPSSTTLRVLYLKSLHEITDVGLVALCSSCSRLEVLDLSYLSGITDQGARCIDRLVFLRALFLRDNWQLTNTSIDSITRTCSRLEQLTLWGCLRLEHLKFDNCNHIGNTIISNRLVILNLWGCHGLEDDVAHVLSSIPNIRCLIVSECHRLSDRFVQILVEGITQKKQGNGGLQHLHLRYLKKITDAAVIAIALNIQELVSLDLSFCSKVTATGIYRLLDELRNSLVELRLKHSLSISSRTFDEDGRRRNHGQQSNNGSNNHAGHWILNALRRRPHSSIDHSLCLLDVRGCGGQPGRDIPYSDEDPFVKGMSALRFEQKVPGFFSRSI